MDFYVLSVNFMKDNSAPGYNHGDQKNEPLHEDLEKNKMDLPDSDWDKERLQPNETTIDLPDVKDIPGQEFVNAPPLGMLADTTISSAGEEGDELFDDDEDQL
jgi:hypothetical protein